MLCIKIKAKKRSSILQEKVEREQLVGAKLITFGKRRTSWSCSCEIVVTITGLPR